MPSSQLIHSSPIFHHLSAEFAMADGVLGQQVFRNSCGLSLNSRAGHRILWDGPRFFFCGEEQSSNAVLSMYKGDYRYIGLYRIGTKKQWYVYIFCVYVYLRLCSGHLLDTAMYCMCFSTGDHQSRGQSASLLSVQSAGSLRWRA